MAGYNNNSNAVQAFKDWQAIPEEVENALDDFSDWVQDNWEDDSLSSEQIEEVIPVIRRAIAQYLKRDTESQALIKAGEMELLDKWSK